MTTHDNTNPKLQNVTEFINQTLCYHERLEAGIFPMTAQVLKRRGVPCGLYVCLHGPRSVKLTAIWDSERNIVLFYGATGHRFLTTKFPLRPAARASSL